jgi:hypothetical protein
MITPSTPTLLKAITWALLIPLAAWLGGSPAFAQGAAFTYQGRLLDGGAPANGSYELQFSLHNAAADGQPVGPQVTPAPVTVTNGLFTVVLDFGTAPFTGADRWIEIRVRTNGSVALPVVLQPRQLLTPSPYAIRAGAVPATGIVGAIAPASIADGSITSSKLAPGVVGTPAYHLDLLSTNRILVSGAGSTEANGVYVWNGSGAYTGTPPYRIEWRTGTGSTRLSDATLDLYSAAAAPYPSLLSPVAYQLVAGGSPAPTVVFFGTNTVTNLVVRGIRYLNDGENLADAVNRLDNGMTLMIGPGTYPVDVTLAEDGGGPCRLFCKTNVTILGHGPATRITGSNVGNFFTLADCERVAFQYLHIDGQKHETGAVHLAHAIALSGLNNDLLFSHCQFYNLYGHAISIESAEGHRSRNVRVLNNHFENLGHPDVIGVGADGACFNGGADDLVFTGNTSWHCIRGVELYSYGDAYTNLVVTGNSFHDPREFGILVRPFVSPKASFRGLVLANNALFGNPARQTGVKRGISVGGAEDLAIMNNLVSGFSNGCVYLHAENYSISNALIAGNLVTDSGYTGIELDDQGGPAEIVNVTVVGNSVTRTHYDGIVLTGRDVACLANTVTDWATGGGPNAAVLVYDGFDQASNIVVIANTVRHTVANPGAGPAFSAWGGLVGALFRENQSHRATHPDYLGANVVTAPVLGTHTQEIAATSIILPTAAMIKLKAGSAITLVTIPTLTTTGVKDNTLVRLQGTSNVNTVTLLDNGLLPGSALELGASTRMLGRGDLLTLVFNAEDGKWYEVSFANN